MSDTKKVDISELYDYIRDRKDPLSLYVKAVRYEGTGAFRYSDFFTSLQTEMNGEYKAVFLKNKN